VSLEEREAYRAAGVDALASKLDVRVVQLSIEHNDQWLAGPLLVSLEKLPNAERRHACEWKITFRSISLAWLPRFLTCGHTVASCKSRRVMPSFT
jgi:hypothetical protein